MAYKKMMTSHKMEATEALLNINVLQV